MTKAKAASFDHYPPIMAQAFAELAKAQAATQAQLDATSAELEKTRNETAAEMKDLASSTKQLQKLYGGMAQNLGDVAEEFFYNTLKDSPVIGDIQFDKFSHKLLIGTKGHEMEFDLVGSNGSSAVIIEVKQKPHLKDLDQIDAQVKFFKAHSPEFKDYKIYGGIAGFSIPTEVVKAAHERGYFVLKRKGKVLTSNTEGMRAF
jgi:hypothetical protein